MKNKNFRFVDINGLGHSGKGVITNYLSEFNGFYLYDELFEFDLFRINGGILDLYHNCFDYWSPIRSSNSITRFNNVAKRLSSSSISRIGIYNKILSYGTDYESIFDNCFMNETNNFISKIIISKESKEFWPYNNIEKSFIQILTIKLLRKLGIKKSEDFNYVDSKNFVEELNNYLNNLYSNIVDPEKYHSILMNNTFEPFRLNKGIRLLKNGKGIIVKRDPRDIFASSLYSPYIPAYEKNIDAKKIKMGFLSSHNVDLFIRNQKILYDNLEQENTERVLILKYENLVLNYDNETLKVKKFLKLNDNDHVNKFKFFNPNLSKKNIGLWKKDEFKMINNKIKDALGEEICFQKT